MKEVNFIKTTSTNYNKMSSHEPTDIFFITDQQQIVVGNMKFGTAYVKVDEQHPLPQVGVSGYLYIDNRNGVSIKLWDESANDYVELSIADRSYIKSIKREEQKIIGTAGDDREDIAPLDDSLTNEDIATLFNSN